MSTKLSIVSVANIIGLIAGIIIFIDGVVTTREYNSTDLKSASFGADFYTYTYDGIRGVDKSVNHMRNDLAEGIGTLISAVGLCLSFICIGNIERSRQNSKIIAALRSENANIVLTAVDKKDLTWKCQNCGYQNDESADFCYNCGTAHIKNN